MDRTIQIHTNWLLSWRLVISCAALTFLHFWRLMYQIFNSTVNLLYWNFWRHRTQHTVRYLPVTIKWNIWESSIYCMLLIEKCLRSGTETCQLHLGSGALDRAVTWLLWIFEIVLYAQSCHVITTLLRLWWCTEQNYWFTSDRWLLEETQAYVALSAFCWRGLVTWLTLLLKTIILFFFVYLLTPSSLCTASFSSLTEIRWLELELRIRLELLLSLIKQRHWLCSNSSIYSIHISCTKWHGFCFLYDWLIKVLGSIEGWSSLRWWMIKLVS